DRGVSCLVVLLSILHPILIAKLIEVLMSHDLSREMWKLKKWLGQLSLLLLLTLGCSLPVVPLQAAGLMAGAAKVDITNTNGLVNDRLFVKALVIKRDAVVT